MKKLVVITGASSGFGTEIAKIFNTDGFPLLLLGRRTEKLEKVASGMENVMIDSVDVTDYDQFE